jgi:hypothetical protein
MRGFIFVSCVLLIIVALYLFVFKWNQPNYYEPKYVSAATWPNSAKDFQYETDQADSTHYANKPLVHNMAINRGFATDNAEHLTNEEPVKEYPEFTPEQIMDLTFAADTSY